MLWQKLLAAIDSNTWDEAHAVLDTMPPASLVSPYTAKEDWTSTPLMRALASPKDPQALALVDRMLAMAPPEVLLERNYDQDSVLRAAVHSAHPRLPYLLGTLPIDVVKHDRDDQGWTLLHLAVRIGLDSVIDQLLPLSDLQAVNDDGEGIVHAAVLSNNLRILQKMWPYVEDSTDHRRTMLNLAVRRPNMMMVDWIMASGLAVLDADEQGQNPLHHLSDVFESSPAVVAMQARLRPMFDPLVRDHKGNTPLMVLVKNGHHNAAVVAAVLAYTPLLDDHCTLTGESLFRQATQIFEPSMPEDWQKDSLHIIDGIAVRSDDHEVQAWVNELNWNDEQRRTLLPMLYMQWEQKALQSAANESMAPSSALPRRRL